MYKHFEGFRDLFECTWDGIRIAEFKAPKAGYEEELCLMLREEGFVAEVSNFGHGLQMWLQIVWFLARTDWQSIVILDEPDVYMHPQQQRRMIQLLRRRFKQCILSTHAPGILEDCHENEILCLHRKFARSSCEIDSSKYEQILEAVAEKPQNNSPNTKDAEIALEVVVYEYGSLRVTNHLGDCVINIPAKKCLAYEPLSDVQVDDEVESEDLGTKESVSIARLHQLHIVATSPDDVEIYIDGNVLDINEFVDGDSSHAEFYVNPVAILDE